MVLDPVDALEEAAGPIYALPCVLGGGLNPGLAVLALVVVVLDIVVPHLHEVELALVVAVAVAVAHEEAAAHGELALADEDHEVLQCGGGLHDC